VIARSRERGQALILLAAWLFFGGGASTALVVYERPASDVKKAVKRVIPDGSRREAMLSDIDQWESVQKKQDKSVRKEREDLLEILRRKGSQHYEADPIITKLDATFSEMDRKFLDLRFRLKEQVTASEWTELARTNP
jgi:hypothetical protein